MYCKLRFLACFLLVRSLAHFLSEKIEGFRTSASKGKVDDCVLNGDGSTEKEKKNKDKMKFDVADFSRLYYAHVGLRTHNEKIN